MRNIRWIRKSCPFQWTLKFYKKEGQYTTLAHQYTGIYYFIRWLSLTLVWFKGE